MLWHCVVHQGSTSPLRTTLRFSLGWHLPAVRRTRQILDVDAAAVWLDSLFAMIWVSRVSSSGRGIIRHAVVDNGIKFSQQFYPGCSRSSRPRTSPTHECKARLVWRARCVSLLSLFGRGPRPCSLAASAYCGACAHYYCGMLQTDRQTNSQPDRKSDR